MRFLLQKKNRKRIQIEESEDQTENNDRFSSDTENDEGENEADSAAIDQVMSTTTPVLVSTEPSVIKSLQNICNDPDVNKDAKFLDDLQKVFKENETSLLFKPHLNKMTAAFNEGRRSLKKRILTQIFPVKEMINGKVISTKTFL